MKNDNGSEQGVQLPPQQAPGAHGKLASLPLPAAAAVFLPVALTTLLYLFAPIRAAVSSAAVGFPMLPFLVYIAVNWLVIGAGSVILRGRVSWRDIGFTNFRWRDMGLAAAAAAIGLFVVYPVSTLLARLIGLEPIKGMNYSLADPFNIASAVLIASLVGPLAEDILFRGFLLSLLHLKIRRTWATALIGILAFTLIHVSYFGWSGVIFILLWSPLSVGLFLWRKSIYPSWALHIINNLWAYVLVPLLFSSNATGRP